MRNKTIKRIFPILVAGFLLVQPALAVAEDLCWDECAYPGKIEYSGSSYRTCGNYDSDYCYEWSGWQQTSTCWDECAYSGKHECSGTSGRTCGNYDSDYCYEWSGWQSCDNQCYSCGDGTCDSQCGETASNCSADCGSSCWDECAYVGKKECTDSTHYRTCGNYDSDYCYEWSSTQSCGAGKTCQNGSCVSQCTSHYTQACYSNDLYWYNSCGAREEKAEECGSDSWTSNYRCSGDWVQREKITGGCSCYSCYSNSQWENYQNCSTLGKVCQSGQCVSTCSDECSQGQKKCYSSTRYQTCGNYDSDSCLEWSSAQNCGADETCQSGECVVSDTNDPPQADAGPNKEVDEDDYVTLEGSGYDPDSDPIDYYWSCTGGSLSDSDIARPRFYAPSVSSDRDYSCTLTVEDSHGASDSDSMNVLVRDEDEDDEDIDVTLTASPDSGCAPLKYVNLKARVSGSATGSVTYYFDCTDDGDWEKTTTQSSTSYTAYNLCSYYDDRTYTARVKVKRGGYTAEDTVRIYADECEDEDEPEVEIEANGHGGSVDIPYDSSVRLTWDSDDADYCYASGDWSGSKSTSGSKRIYNVTSSKRYTITCEDDDGDSDSDTVRVYVYGRGGTADFNVKKLGRNISDGGSWTDYVVADPNDIISFSIEIEAGDSDVDDVIVKDTLPTKMVYLGGLEIDGRSSSGNIISGLDIGDLDSNETKTITFKAQVAGVEQFAFGETALTNTVLVYNSDVAETDTARVTVTRSGIVAGAATGVSTGLTNNVFLDSFLLPLLITLLIIWILKSRIIRFEEWLDSRKRRGKEYSSKKLLQMKITKIKMGELLKRKMF